MKEVRGSAVLTARAGRVERERSAGVPAEWSGSALRVLPAARAFPARLGDADARRRRLSAGPGAAASTAADPRGGGRDHEAARRGGGDEARGPVRRVRGSRDAARVSRRLRPATSSPLAAREAP
ncbi:unnamed protein product [Lampetra fluviatilis]